MTDAEKAALLQQLRQIAREELARVGLGRLRRATTSEFRPSLDPAFRAADERVQELKARWLAP